MRNPNELKVSNNVSLLMDDIEMNFICAQGSGGQNVNKVSPCVNAVDLSIRNSPGFILLPFIDRFS